MGVIQGSINNMLGTAGVIAGLGKNAMEQQDANILKKAEVGGQLNAMEEEISGLKEKQAGLMQEMPGAGTPEWDKATAEATRDDVEPGAINSVIGGTTTNNDIIAFNRAMESASNAIAAKENQLAAFKRTYDNIGKSMIERAFGRKK